MLTLYTDSVVKRGGHAVGIIWQVTHVLCVGSHNAYFCLCHLSILCAVGGVNTGGPSLQVTDCLPSLQTLYTDSGVPYTL